MAMKKGKAHSKEEMGEFKKIKSGKMTAAQYAKAEKKEYGKGMKGGKGKRAC